MRFRKYSFYKITESQFRIDIGFHDGKQMDSIDVGKGTEIDEIKKLRDEKSTLEC